MGLFPLCWVWLYCVSCKSPLRDCGTVSSLLGVVVLCVLQITLERDCGTVSSLLGVVVLCVLQITLERLWDCFLSVGCGCIVCLANHP